MNVVILFTTAITRLTEKFTKQIKCHQNKNGLPWLNNEATKLMKMRDMANKKSLRSKLDTDLLNYKKLRNKVIQELRKAKASYYTQLIDNAKGSNNSLWKYLNNLTNKTSKSIGIREVSVDGKIINNNAAMANNFNSYFVQSVEDLTKDCVTTKPPTCSSLSASADCFFIKTTDESKVAQIIAKLSNSKSNDIKLIVAFLKDIAVS